MKTAHRYAVRREYIIYIWEGEKHVHCDDGNTLRERESVSVKNSGHEILQEILQERVT